MNQPNHSNKDKQKRDTHLRRNLVFSASTVVFAVLVLIFYVISNLPALSSFLGKILSVLTPVIGGAALAYLCNPILNFFEKHPLRRIRSLYVKRMLSIFLTYLFFILVIAAIGLLIVPQLISSVKELIAQYENYVANAVTNINQIITRVMENLHIPGADGAVQEFLSLEKINAFLERLVGSAGDVLNMLIENIQSYGAKLFSTISNTILSLFISFYLLASKEKRVAQVKKLTAALLNEKQNKFFYETASLAHNAFGGFLGGKLLDAFFVGIVYFIVFSIFGVPYSAMLATIMGVMNILPFFGPLIGAVPSCFIVLISAPEKIIIFIILVLVVGQIDANIIEPKVLGDRTGVSSLCVIIAISVMGNLWGFFGMIIGVPLFAVVVALVEQYANAKLAKKGLSDDLDDYYDDDDEFAYESVEGVRLSKRYYKDRFVYMFTRKSRRGPKPRREDYLIYPTTPEEEEAFEEIEAVESAPIDTAFEEPMDEAPEASADEAEAEEDVTDDLAEDAQEDNEKTDDASVAADAE